MQYDYIIIGAGSSGSVIANRLSEDKGCKVLLLEAGSKPNAISKMPGGYVLLHRSKMDWAFWTEPQVNVNNRKLFVPRGKVLGGCSTTNAMAYVRGNAANYDAWAAAGNEGWSYNEVLPYFKKSEQHAVYENEFHQKGGLLHVSFAQHPSPLTKVFIEACEEKGIPFNEDYNGAHQEGASMLQFTIKNNKRFSTAEAFLRPAIKRTNLTIRTNVLVKQVIVEHDTAIGVELYTGARSTEKIFCAKEVIVSAGAIKSPQLLMLSGIGDKNELSPFDIACKIELQGVGKNLQDHVCTGTNALSSVPTANSAIKPAGMLKAFAQYLVLNKGPFTNSPIEANAFIKTNENRSIPDIQFHFAPVYTGNDYKTDIHNLKTYPLTNGFSIVCILLNPESSGYVALKSADASDAPVIQPNFFQSLDDKEILLKGLKKAMEVIDAGAFRPYSPKGLHHPVRNATDDELAEHLCKSLETLYHPVGTCQMGSGSMAVVNERLQVWGIRNLRVADASIMPNIISGNTNAACIMIGEKAADMIKENF